MSEDQIKTASLLWRAGVLAAKIADMVGVHVRRIHEAAKRDRVNFPYRETARWRRPNPAAFIAQPLHGVSASRPDTMRFTTSTGYVCTMPRVSILEKAG
jgi:thiamine biosynthesis protein ThiC